LAYQDFCESLLSVAKQSLPRVPRKNYVPCWDKECEALYCSFIRAPVGTDSDRAASSLLSLLEQKKQERWEEAVNSIDFPHSNRKAYSTINKLTGRSGRSSCLRPVWTNFRPEEFAAALRRLKPVKSLGLNSIFLKFILHSRSALKSWFCDFLTSCMRLFKIPKIWRRALIFAITQPESHFETLRTTVSLLRVPIKLLKRLIYAGVDPIIDPLLPREQAAFDMKGRL